MPIEVDRGPRGAAEELPPLRFLDVAQRLIGPLTSVLSEVRPLPAMGDYPSIWQFYAMAARPPTLLDTDLHQRTGFGTSLSRARAMARAVGEALERYAASYYDSASFIADRAGAHEKTSLDLHRLGRLSTYPDRIPQECRWTEESYFAWTSATSWPQNRLCLVPAQLVYIPYQFSRREPVLRSSITTGLACSTTWWSAALRALCEVIERDAFMLHHLHAHAGERLGQQWYRQLPADYQAWINQLEAQGLELHLADFSTDIPVPVILATVIDRRWASELRHPLFQLGCSATPDAIMATCKAIEEAIQVLYWQRREWSQPDTLPRKITALQALKIKTLRDRAEYWISSGRPLHARYLWDSNAEAPRPRYTSRKVGTARSEFLRLAAELGQQGFEVLTVDLTPAELLDHGIHVVRCIVPELVPLHLVERYRCVGLDRIYSAPRRLNWAGAKSHEDQLNRVVHPFL